MNKSILITELQLKCLVSDYTLQNTLNECTVAGVRLNDGIVLAKNRDRGYEAEMEIVHEVVNNVEVLYWHDVDTDWSEGMNEFGIGIVNSSLMVGDDEKEGDKVKQSRKERKREDKKKSVKHASDGAKIRQALTQKNLRDCIKVLITTKGDGTAKVKGVTGQSIVSDGKEIYIIEHSSVDVPIVKKLKDNKKVVVRTNHGIFHKDLGYQSGFKKNSSHSRMELAKQNLQNAETDQDVIDILKKKYKKDPFLNPYRTTNKHHMQTVGQIMMNCDLKEVTIRLDKKYGELTGIENLLPKGYEPKIKLKIEN
jgi:uncharacterized pyridoxamine 5'-phosphate oxidase family protein